MSLLDTASLILTPNGYKGGVTTGKLYSVKPTDASGDLVVSRATTATRVNSSNLIESVAINVPRLDYTLGSCPSILVEPQRTNLALRSEEFDNAIWSKTGVTVTANAVNSPTGTLTADLITPTILDAKINQGFNPTGALQHNFSVYLRSATGSSFSTVLRITRDSPFSSVANTVITVTTEWQRFNLSFTALDSTTHQATIGAGSTLSTGENFYAWGAQCELGSNASSYIPTTTATVTRNADVISNTGVSSLIGQTEGTIYAEINNTLMTYAVTGYVMRIFADANNEVWIRKESGTNKYTARWRANSVDVYTQSTISVLNGNNKIAIAYKTGDSAVYLNGTQIGTSASTGAFAVAPSQIGIGSTSTADFFNDRIELATVFQTRLTNAQLATLTTL
jgi:hypothetical protein